MLRDAVAAPEQFSRQANDAVMRDGGAASQRVQHHDEQRNQKERGKQDQRRVNRDSRQAETVTHARLPCAASTSSRTNMAPARNQASTAASPRRPSRRRGHLAGTGSRK